MIDQKTLITDTYLEKAIIGAALMSPDAISGLAGVLTADDFLMAKNREIWDIIAKLFADSRAIDTVIVNQELGDMPYLLSCIDSVGMSCNLTDYVRILRENSCKRKIIDACRADHNPEQMASEIWDIVSTLKTGEFDEYTIEELVKMTHEIASNNEGTKYRFNLSVLQKKTAGFDLHESIIIGGYPSFGKSALATHITIGLAEAGARILYLTAEQSEIDMTRNILANICHINTMDFRAGRYSEKDKNKVLEAESRIKKWDYTIRRVTSTADIYKEVKKHRPEIVVIDYLQNLAPAKAGISSHQRDTDNMGIIQNMTIKEPIATITLSQLSRPADKKMKRPNMTSFMNTSAIEQKASIALLCWWQAKADDIVDRTNAEGYEIYEINVVKSKMGPTGVCRVEYAPEYCHFQRWINPAEEIQVFGAKGFKNVIIGDKND